MAARLQLKLVTPVGTVFDQEVDHVIIPTTTGQITVLPQHAPLVSILQAGELVVKDGAKEFPLAVAGGALEVSNNALIILADSAEHAESIDVTAAEKRAEELAEMLKAEQALDMTTYNALQKQLERERAKLLVGKKWRK